MLKRNQKKEKNANKKEKENNSQSKIREGQSDSAIEKNNLIANNPYPGLSKKDIQNKNQEEFETRPHSKPQANAG
jgi:hypothetical protein